MSRLTLE